MAGPTLYDFAWIPNIDEQLQDLADNVIMRENWSYRHSPNDRPNPILFSYFIHTFERLQEQDRITTEDDWACFNTGLVTPNQEEVFAVFEKNRVPDRQPWYFKGFRRESDRDLIRFGTLPDIASYFDEPSDLLYDPRLDLRPRYDHIIDDNQERFPEPYNDSADPHVRHQLRNVLEGAIEHAKRRIQRNYKTAVPQFHQGRLQLLIPLCITARSKADLALVVEKTHNAYTAATCLPLDWAYNNARLIARPDNEWLTP
jgi:hypothetical protein